MFDLMPFRSGKNTRRGRTPSERMFEDFLTDTMDMFRSSFKTDVIEKDYEYIIEAELPGMSRDDINIELQDDLLTISAEQELEDREESENYIRKERRTGKFQRSFQIENIDEDEISAEFDNGILKVNLPKEETTSSERRTIDIE